MSRRRIVPSCCLFQAKLEYWYIYGTSKTCKRDLYHIWKCIQHAGVFLS